ncbi:hypothetical protein B566_EDAN002873 [Ephemera danica]|nr:hypothetical protein B566_EDAN002873 [Ephemera danica]
MTETKSTVDSRMAMYTRIEMKAHSSVALAAAVAAVKQLETDFNTATLTFSKLDLVATYKTKFPGVNNWGLQFYREADILFMEADSSTSNLQRIWQLVTHEVSHQWFGDVATFPWWDEIWLSEGIATYFEYFTPLEVQALCEC